MHTQQLSLANSGAQSDAKIGHTVLDTLCQLASESGPHSDTLLTDMRQELPVSEVLRQWMDEVRETEQWARSQYTLVGLYPIRLRVWGKLCGYDPFVTHSSTF